MDPRLELKAVEATVACRRREAEKQVRRRVGP
jgi:hypothetical protein